MKNLILILILFTSLFVFSDTPPPGTVKAKMFSGDGNTAITTGTNGAMNVNILSSGSTTVNQGNAGLQSWLAQITSSVLPTNAAQETGGVLASINSKTPALGQSTMSGSVPVVISSNQSNVPISGSVGLNAGSNTIGAISNSSFGISGTLPAFASTPLVNSAQSGTWNVAVTSGTITANAGTGTFTVDASGHTVPVSGTFWQATQPVSGSVTATISGTPNVAVTSSVLPTGAATETTLNSIHTVLGSPFQAGGSIGNTSFAATQSTAASLNATVVGPSGVALAKDSSLTTINSTLGSPMQNSGGSVTANAGTNLNTSALALESGGHLASIDTKTPALGQALSASSVPVVLPASQITTLTPLSTVTVNQGTAGATAWPITGGNTKPVNIAFSNSGSIDALGSLTTTTRINQVSAQFLFANNMANMISQTNSGGASGAIVSNGAAQFQTGTATTAKATGVTLNKTTYSSGHEIYAEFTAAFTTPTSANSYQRIGLYDANNGFYVGYNGTTFQFCKRLLTVDTCTSKSSWNGDTLTGGGTSLFTRNGVPEAINLNFANLYRIRFGWFGSAIIVLEVYSPDGQWVTANTINQPNSAQFPSIATPNLPITIEVSKSSADATNLIMTTACWAAGTASASPPSFVNNNGQTLVVGEGSTILEDDFDTLETTLRWNTPVTVSGGTYSIGASQLTITTGTTSNASLVLSSKPVIATDGASAVIVEYILKLEPTALISNVYRFWGRASYSGTAVQNGVGFETDTSGNLNAVIYASGSKIYSQTLTAPTDGQYHDYYVSAKANQVYWWVDPANLAAPPTALTTQLIDIPASQPILMIMANSVTPPTSAPTFNIMQMLSYYTGQNSINLSDNVNPWIKSTIKNGTNVVTSSDNALVVTVSPNTPAIATLAPVNANSSLGARQTVTTGETYLVAPSNTVGVIIECESGNSDNLRWGFSNSTGSILSSTLGMLCEPGRDSGVIPIGSGNYLHMISTGSVGSDYIDVQWLKAN